MVNLKDNPVDIDINIQSLQKFLYKKLKVDWPVDDTKLESYGRAYRNSNDKGYVPELFVSSSKPNNTEYKPAFFDKENWSGMFFFDADDTLTYKEGVGTIKIYIIFIVNVPRLKPNIQHRGDVEIRNNVRKWCSMGLYQMNLIGDENGFANVFKRFPGLINKDGEVFEDRHPMYCFKMNMEMIYAPGEVKCL